MLTYIPPVANTTGRKTHVLTGALTITGLFITFIVFYTCGLLITFGNTTFGQRPLFPDVLPIKIKILFYLQVTYLLHPVGLLPSLIVSIIFRNDSSQGKGLMILNIFFFIIVIIWMLIVGVTNVFPWTAYDLNLFLSSL